MPHHHGLTCFDTKGRITCVSAAVLKRQEHAAAERARWKNYIWKVRAGNVTIVALPGEGYRAPEAMSETRGFVQIVIDLGLSHYRPLTSRMLASSGKHWQLRELLGLAHYDSADSAYQHLKKPVTRMAAGHSYASLPDDGGVSPLGHAPLPEQAISPTKLRNLHRPVIIMSKRNGRLATLADVIDSEGPYLTVWEWRKKPRRWAHYSTRIRQDDVVRPATEADLVAYGLPKTEW